MQEKDDEALGTAHKDPGVPLQRGQRWLTHMDSAYVWRMLSRNHCRECSRWGLSKGRILASGNLHCRCWAEFQPGTMAEAAIKGMKKGGRKRKHPSSLRSSPASCNSTHPMYTVCQDDRRCFSSSIIIREVIWRGNYSYPHDPDDDHRH